MSVMKRWRRDVRRRIGGGENAWRRNGGGEKSRFGKLVISTRQQSNQLRLNIQILFLKLIFFLKLWGNRIRLGSFKFITHKTNLLPCSIQAITDRSRINLGS